MSVLRVVRALVLVEWGLIALTVASFFVELSAPERLREVSPEGDAELPSTLAVLAAGAASLVHLVASAGLWRLAPWARPAYAASTVALLLSGLFLGPSAFSPVSGTLGFASTYAGGALLAVLYLPSLVPASSTAVPATAPAAAPAARGRLRVLAGIGAALTAGFAIVGLVLTTAGAAAVYFMLGFGEVMDEAQRAAEGKTDADCLALALAREGATRWLVPESTFLTECLAYAEATAGLCAGVPREADKAATASWIALRCDGPESPPRCASLMAVLPPHCEERR